MSRASLILFLVLVSVCLSASQAQEAPAVDLVISAGDGIHQSVIENNIVYNWHQSLFLSGSNFSSTIVQNNDFQDVASLFPNDRIIHLVELREALNPSAVTFSGNTYYSYRDPGKWFQIGSAEMSFDGWVSSSGETGAQSTLVEYPDPNRDLGTYNEFIGGAATFGAFIAEARKQDENNWRLEYTAAPVIAYIREGFGR